MIILHAFKQFLIDGKILYKIITVLAGVIVSLVSWGLMQLYNDYKSLESDYKDHISEVTPRMAIFDEMVINQKKMLENQIEMSKDVAVMKYVFLYGSPPPQIMRNSP